MQILLGRPLSEPRACSEEPEGSPAPVPGTAMGATASISRCSFRFVCVHHRPSFEELRRCPQQLGSLHLHLPALPFIISRASVPLGPEKAHSTPGGIENILQSQNDVIFL